MRTRCAGPSAPTCWPGRSAPAAVYGRTNRGRRQPARGESTRRAPTSTGCGCCAATRRHRRAVPGRDSARHPVIPGSTSWPRRQRGAPETVARAGRRAAVGAVRWCTPGAPSAPVTSRPSPRSALTVAGSGRGGSGAGPGADQPGGRARVHPSNAATLAESVLAWHELAGCCGPARDHGLPLRAGRLAGGVFRSWCTRHRPHPARCTAPQLRRILMPDGDPPPDAGCKTLRLRAFRGPGPR